MDLEKTAVVFIGYQNDYFANDGILRGVIEEPGRSSTVLANTIALIRQLEPSEALLISTPIIFTPDYEELSEPVGILKAIKDAEAFKAGTTGSETIKEFQSFAERILEVPGKRGLNAFSNTELHDILKSNGITDLVLAGAVTSICIDSTGRAGFENGYAVHILEDCTASRTPLEQQFYCDTIFPLYANVISSKTLYP